MFAIDAYKAHVAINSAVKREVRNLRIHEIVWRIVNHYGKQIVLFNVVELDSERRITAVVRANVFSVEIHFCGGICTVDLQIHLFSTWKILLFQLFHKATCSAEIVVSAVLSVFTVPCVRQI